MLQSTHVHRNNGHPRRRWLFFRAKTSSGSRRQTRSLTQVGSGPWGWHWGMGAWNSSLNCQVFTAADLSLPLPFVILQLVFKILWASLEFDLYKELLDTWLRHSGQRCLSPAPVTGPSTRIHYSRPVVTASLIGYQDIYFNFGVCDVTYFSVSPFAFHWLCGLEWKKSSANL